MDFTMPSFDWYAVAVTLVLIVFDFATGIAKGAATSKIDSSVMRKGMWHKLASVCVIILAIIVDCAFGHMDLGFPALLTPAVCAYIALMEVASVLENIGEINPELKNNALMKLFNKADK